MNAEPPAGEKSRAVLISSRIFTDSTFAELEAVERTVEKVSEQLRDPAVWGLRLDHCQEILTHKSNPAEILSVVQAASQAAEECFVLYFAGHGVEEGGQLLLPLTHSRADMPSTMLAFADLMNAVGSGPAPIKLVLLDCCHAGLAMDVLPFEQHVAGEAPEGCYVLAACEANRTAKSPEDNEFTAFGQALITCLVAGGPSTEQFWTPRQLLAHVDKWLTSRGYPRPVTNDSRVGELPWVRNRRFVKPFEAAGYQAPAPDSDSGTPAQPEKIQYLGPDPLPLPIPFLGRDALLGEARPMVRMGQVLPVMGRAQVGKSALLTSLLAKADLLPAGSLPPVVLEIEPSAAAESPLMEAITRALHQTLDDSEFMVAAKRTTDGLLDLVLPRQVKGRSLILVIKASRIDLNRPELREELDELLRQDVFKRAAVIVETTETVEIDGGSHRPRPLVVPALATSDALALIGDWLADENLVTDVNGLDLVGYDEIVRRPGVIERAVRLVCRIHRKDDYDSFLAGFDARSRAAVEIGPEEFEEALMEAAEPTIAGVLDRAWSTATGTDRTKGQALLTVWGVIDELPLPVVALRGMGLPDSVLRVLFNEGILVPWRPAADSGPPAGDSPRLEVSPVSREALRNDLLRTIRSTADMAAGADGERPCDVVDRNLIAAGRLLANTVLPSGETEGESEAVPRVIEALRRAVGWIDRHVPDALPGLRARLGLYVNGDSADAVLLPVAQTIGSVPLTDPANTSPETVSRTGAESERSAARNAVANGAEPGNGAVRGWELIDELYAAAGRLNLASRASVQEPDAVATFLSAFEYAVSLLEVCGEAAPWRVLRSVDQCGFHGARRHRALAQVAPARERLTRQLAALHEGPANVSLNRLLWSTSWILNTAAAQISADVSADASDSLELAEQLIEVFPLAQESRARQTRNWFLYRLAGLRRATATTADERRTAVRSAYELANENARLASVVPERQQQWTHNLLASGYMYAQETRGDGERLELARETLSALEEAWGSRDDWPVPLVVEAAGFLRRVHERHADLELQYAGAREVLALLNGRAGSLADREGPSATMPLDHMVELAEANAFLAYVYRERNDHASARHSLQQGVRMARIAVRSFPTGRTYMTWLRLLRTKQAWSGGGRGRTLLPEHAKAVEEVRRWLDSGEEVRAGNQSLALLHLWCLDSDWQREGTLVVAAQAVPVHNTGWNTGRSLQQVRADQVHRGRWNALMAHERVYGPTWALYEARIRITREYQRWTAIYSRRPQEVDHGPVWELLDRAGQLFPRNLDVMRSRASYHRYIWEYGEAARLHAEAARQERDGDRWRRGLIEASECLLRQAIYEKGISSAARESALCAASDYLQEVTELHTQAPRVSLLSARIALELGRPVDWDLADSKFAELIGDDYVGNVGRYLNERRDRTAADIDSGPAADSVEWEHAAAPHEALVVDDLLEEHFTDVEVLMSLGSLYLRRSILNAEQDPEAARSSAWRAYNCFDGRRVMEAAVNGQEKVDTAFMRGQTIAWAAELAGSTDPFPRDSGWQRGWLDLAESRLQSARSRSAGGFHELVCTWDSRLRALKAGLRRK
ncbi:caspase family protein [Kitasatospora sp. NPDC127116]|uniref:caspase, EACC1-associated type n=1 Tax=Kitasatospora sp. NPDC127116 TaxID=3345367 RepID=UPI00362ED3C7